MNGTQESHAPAVLEFVHGGATQLHRGGGAEEGSEDLLGDRGNFGFPGNYGFKVGITRILTTISTQSGILCS